MLKKFARIVGGNFFNIAVGAILSIYLARVLGPENRGLLSLYVGLATILSTIFGLGISHACSFFVRAEPGCLYSLTRASLLIASTAAIASITALTFFGTHFSKFFLNGTPISPFVVFTIFILVAVGIYGGCTGGMLIALGDAKGFANSSNIGSSFGFIATVAALSATHANHTTTALACSTIAPLTSSLLQSLALNRNWLPRTPHDTPRIPLTRIVQFGLKTQLAAVSSLAFKRFDLFVVSYFQGLTAVGYYSVALSLRDLALVPPRAAAGLVGGDVADPVKKKTGDSRPLIKKSSLYFLAYGVAASLIGIMVFPQAIPLLYGQLFVGSIQTAQIVLCSVVFMSPAMIFNQCLISLGYPFFSSMVLLLSSVPSLAAMWMLTQNYGLVGTGWATVFSGFTLYVFGWSALAISKSAPFQNPRHST